MLVEIGENQYHEISVPGWEELLDKHSTWAFTLQGMANLEYRQATLGNPAPTQQDILKEVRRLQRQNGYKVLGVKSGYMIQKAIKKLIDLGHVHPKTGYETNRKGGRGGPASPWVTKYIFPLIDQSVKEKLNKETCSTP